MLPDLETIIGQLERCYGRPERASSRPDPVDELVMTMLSQNTSDTNTDRAFSGLKSAFASWQAVIDANTEDVIEAIRPGGLANQKAPRIQEVLSRIQKERGDFDLGFLGNLPVGEAIQWLIRLPGVGRKTAACVLLFSLDVPTMPVDTHVHRVALRLGLIPAGTNANDAQDLLGTGMSAQETYNAHMLMIKHGRLTCKARNPRCADCVLNKECPSAAQLMTIGTR
jgi:endonuclease III